MRVHCSTSRAGWRQSGCGGRSQSSAFVAERQGGLEGRTKGSQDCFLCVQQRTLSLGAVGSGLAGANQERAWRAALGGVVEEEPAL